MRFLRCAIPLVISIPHGSAMELIIRRTFQICSDGRKLLDFALAFGSFIEVSGRIGERPGRRVSGGEPGVNFDDVRRYAAYVRAGTATRTGGCCRLGNNDRLGGLFCIRPGQAVDELVNTSGSGVFQGSFLESTLVT